MIIITLARKPMSEPTVASNVLRHETGGINIEGCRIEWSGDKPSQHEWNRMGATGVIGAHGFAGQFSAGLKQAYADGKIKVPTGRWPANVILDGSEEVLSTFPDVGGGQWKVGGLPRTPTAHIHLISGMPREDSVMNYGDSGSAARFFKQVVK